MHQTYEQRLKNCEHPLTQQLLTTMLEKESNLAISADVTTKNQLLKLIEQVGQEICVLKTHIDIIDDFDPELTKELQFLAKKHQFIIFEDRKFADIGSTVQKQYGHGAFKIAEWASLVNAHSLPGPGVIDGLKQVGQPKGNALLLIAELSCKGNLIDDQYRQQTVQWAKAHPEFVIGFIAQQQLCDDPQLLTFTPGVQLQRGGDELGQQYNTPADVITQRGSDIIIVGRGIYAADDPSAAAKIFRQAGWDAYCDRKNTTVSYT